MDKEFEPEVALVRVAVLMLVVVLGAMVVLGR